MQNPLEASAVPRRPALNQMHPAVSAAPRKTSTAVRQGSAMAHPLAVVTHAAMTSRIAVQPHRVSAVPRRAMTVDQQGSAKALPLVAERVARTRNPIADPRDRVSAVSSPAMTADHRAMEPAASLTAETVRMTLLANRFRRFTTSRSKPLLSLLTLVRVSNFRTWA